METNLNQKNVSTVAIMKAKGIKRENAAGVWEDPDSRGWVKRKPLAEQNWEDGRWAWCQRDQEEHA